MADRKARMKVERKGKKWKEGRMAGREAGINVERKNRKKWK